MKSERLPNKAMAKLYGMPMIERLIERVTETGAEPVICTSMNHEDDIIEQWAEKSETYCVRGGELDVMGRFLEAAKRCDADHIVRVTGDNPLTDAWQMEKMIDLHYEKQADYTTCFDLPRGTRPEIIKVSALKELYKKIDPDKSEYMTYQLLEMDKIAVYESGIGRRDVRLTVDTPEDLKKIQKLYEDYKGYPPSLEEIIKWSDNYHGFS
jgi:spore coat polysaccharide biosynthesis protein SpsF